MDNSAEIARLEAEIQRLKLQDQALQLRKFLYFEAPPRNFYGSLCLRLRDKHPEWCVENFDGFDWKPCPQEVYDVLFKHYGSNLRTHDDAEN